MEQLVEKCTSENNTAEDWGLIIQICEYAEGAKDKAKEIIQSIISRLSHKNVNVILYSLTLSNALVQNCNLFVKQEIASRPFLQQLLRILNAPKTHITVKNRILDLVQTWAGAFQGEPTLDYMNEVYRELKSESLLRFDSGQQFPTQGPSSPVKKTAVARQKEEEELQLAMAISLSQQEAAKNEAPKSTTTVKQQPQYLFQVRALYDFTPTETGELALNKGDVVEVYDHTTYPDWWKGSNRGQIGIFPANYVERIGASGGSTEGSASSQAHVLDDNEQLLQFMPSILELKKSISNADPLGHNHAENERLQREYQKVVELVPVVLKRATAQRKKQDELGLLLEQFTSACATYQGVMSSYNASRPTAATSYYAQYPQQGYQQAPPQSFGYASPQQQPGMYIPPPTGGYPYPPPQ